MKNSDPGNRIIFQEDLLVLDLLLRLPPGSVPGVGGDKLKLGAKTNRMLFNNNPSIYNAPISCPLYQACFKHLPPSSQWVFNFYSQYIQDVILTATKTRTKYGDVFHKEARAEMSTLKNAKLCKIGVECVEFM